MLLWLYIIIYMGKIMVKIIDCLNRTQAANFLGINITTLRMWERKGKIKSYKHPMTGYPLFNKQELQDLIRLIESELIVADIKMVND